MLFHGKALEVYTAAYQNIQKIDEEEDLEVFQHSLYPQDYSSRLDIVRANSKSPLQRSLSAKCVSGTGQVLTCRLRKDQQTEDDDEEEEQQQQRGNGAHWVQQGRHQVAQGVPVPEDEGR